MGHLLMKSHNVVRILKAIYHNDRIHKLYHIISSSSQKWLIQIVPDKKENADDDDRNADDGDDNWKQHMVCGGWGRDKLVFHYIFKRFVSALLVQV